MYSKYSSILIKSFPKNLENDVLFVLNFLKSKKLDIYNNEEYNVNLKSENLFIPYRIYFEYFEINSLTNIQKNIIFCLGLRHPNGFIREKYLCKIIEHEELYDFVIPFTFLLLGDYVLSIILTVEPYIYSHINQFKEFRKENYTLSLKSQSRMTSYWDAYYRTAYPKLKKYPAYNLFKLINKNENNR